MTTHSYYLLDSSLFALRNYWGKFTYAAGSYIHLLSHLVLAKPREMFPFWFISVITTLTDPNTFTFISATTQPFSSKDQGNFEEVPERSEGSSTKHHWSPCVSPEASPLKDVWSTPLESSISNIMSAPVLLRVTSLKSWTCIFGRCRRPSLRSSVGNWLYQSVL